MNRFKGWDNDFALKEDLCKYVRENMRRDEILSFVKRDYTQYTWSLRTLDRRLRYFDIRYIDRNVGLEQARAAVQEELEGPGKLLGYRPMHQKIRQVHHLNVPRHLVHNIMHDLDPEGLQGRALGKNVRVKGHFTTKGTNFVHSLDGHAKLMGYQRDTFPLAIYGCIDTASRKLLWLKIWISHSDPRLIVRWYFDYIYETRTISSKIRIDKGTETGKLATMHAFLRRHHEDNMDPMDTVIFGPSTSNQVFINSVLLHGSVQIM